MSTISRFLSIAGMSLLVAAGCSSGGTKKADSDGGRDGGASGSSGDAGHHDQDAGGTPKSDAGVAKDGGSPGCGSVATCPTPATCDRSGTKPVCVCPKGYKFDATCVDVDECADATLNDCASNATCTNTKGSFECACPAPAYKGDGKTCACALGFSADSGKCLANDAKTCTSGNECVHGHCIAGVCCASACDAPPLCRIADGVTCENGSTCVFKPLADDTVCDDGNLCTAGDKCSSGTCHGDGTGVSANMVCKDNDACATGYHCKGDLDGTCEPTTSTDCSSFATTCHSAMCDSVTGCFSAPLADGTLCEDGEQCTVGETCTAGACGGGTTASCDDSNPCTDDPACVVGTGCPAKIPVTISVVCDDGNPCTTNDHCSPDGLCHDTQPVACDDGKACTDDSCEVSDTTGDPCRHMNNSAACQDGNSCTANDICQAGVCGRSGTLYSACGARATDCTQGSPNTCVCEQPLYVNSGGTCVPNDNECVTGNPCVASAACLDTSSSAGGVQCTCPTGFAGDGMTAGSGCTACNPPNTVVNHACVCDMNGTFAVRMQLNWQWPAAQVIGITTLEAGTATTNSWSMRTQTYDANGNLSIVSIPCGATTPDICSPFTLKAYAQFLTNQMWSSTTAGSINPQTSMAYTVPPLGGAIALPNAVAGQPYVEPLIAGLVGIHLDDPLGAWPASRSQVGADKDHKGSVNGAYWVDHDSDSNPAATGYAVPPGGISADGTIPDPPTNYMATSPACPRDPMNDNGTAPWAYDYWPSPAANGEVIAQFQIASRARSYLDGMIESCNLIDGSVKGPDNGQVQTEARFAGCRTSSSQACLDATLDGMGAFSGVDTQPQTQHVTSASFIMKRIPATGTCADVRALSFP